MEDRAVHIPVRAKGGRIKTNWCVITGGPGSGKTTTINELGKLGYQTTIEHARHYIDTQRQQGRTVEEIRNNQQAFQMGVLQMQLDQEAALDPSKLVFLDRALPDAIAYCIFLNIPVNEALCNAVEKYHYKKIFILECLPLVQDYARREDGAAQKRIHELLKEVYAELGFEIVHVPVLPVGERVSFIIAHL